MRISHLIRSGDWLQAFTPQNRWPAPLLQFLLCMKQLIHECLHLWLQGYFFCILNCHAGSSSASYSSTTDQPSLDQSAKFIIFCLFRQLRHRKKLSLVMKSRNLIGQTQVSDFRRNLIASCTVAARTSAHSHTSAKITKFTWKL